MTTRQPGASPPYRRDWQELLRWLLVAVAASGAVLRFFSTRQIGGTDDRWYATMLMDYLHQLRTGHFPVIAGQGTFAWNGGVHPFRSAPMYMWVAGLWDLVSFGHLRVFLVQHLAVITSALAGSFGAYALGCWSLPNRRWAAALLASLFAMTPAWAALINHDEAYMSYMAFMMMPLILYGNLKAVKEPGYDAYRILAVGLALVWMCHPPIATMTTLASMAVQTGAVLANEDFPFVQALLGLLWFPLLDAYYFLSMSELPKHPEDPVASLMALLGLIAYVIGIGRFALQGRGVWWALLGLAGAGMIAHTQHPWLIWIGVTTGLLLPVCWLWPRRHLRARSGAAADLMVAALLIASGIAMAILGPEKEHWGEAHVRGAVGSGHLLSYYASLKPSALMPEAGFGLPVFGPAFVIMAVGLVGLTAIYRPRPLRLFVAVSLVFGVSCMGVPLAGPFLIGYFPDYIATVGTFGLSIRFMPVWASFLFAALLLAMGYLPKRAAWASVALLAGLVVWQGWYTWLEDRLWGPGYEQHTEASLLPENLPLARFAYDLLPMPSTYTDALDDPRLECRLIDAQGAELVGPSDNARAAEALQHESFPLRANRYLENSKVSLGFDRTIDLLPHQRMLVRFEFNGEKPPVGWLLAYTSEGDYREWHLPMTGFPRGFGAQPGGSRVVMFNNSTDVAKHYELQFQKPSGSPLEPGSVVAILTTSTWMPEVEPVSLRSLVPLTATINAPKACYFESCRVFLPGYAATVDGVPATVEESAEHQAMVPVPAGKHTVVMTLGLTPRIRVGGWVSLLAWTGLGVSLYRRRRRA